jgi:hypothetical protein
MIDIPILDGKYRITSDPLTYVISERRVIDPTKSPNWAKMKAEGKSPAPRIEYRELSYPSTMEYALQYIIDREVKSSNVRSLDEYIAEIKRLRTAVILPVK